MPDSNETLSPETLARVCEAVEQFDAAWQAVAEGAVRPRMEDLLKSIPADDQTVCLQEILAVELECRRKIGEQPNIGEYAARFASHQTVIAAAFQTADETLAEGPSRRRRSWPVRLNCPHCHNPVEVILKSKYDDVCCPACGNGLRIEASRSLTWNPQRLPSLAQFELLEQVGRGAFGSVYKARDRELQRIVAVKIPRSGVLNTAEDEDRFLREARNAAQLRHPGIVPVHSVGRSETFPYLVSEFVDGVTLSEYLTAKRFRSQDAAKLVRDLAVALHHAHLQGVIHRDLKPSNIMLSADCTPRIMDFGCAKRDVGEITVTLDGQILGTPAYMSPEQARGLSHHADARSDVYSLGVILFQLLTGELPFRGDIRMLLHQVLHDEPPNPRQLNHQVPRDLATITLKCLAKDPKRRYSAAADLAEDLSRCLDGRPILARPFGRLERAWRWCRREPKLAVVSLLFGMALTGLLTGSLIANWLISAARDRESDANRKLGGANRQLAEQIDQTRKSEAAAKEEAQKATRVAGLLVSLFRSSDPVGLHGTGLRFPGEDAATVDVRDLLDRGAKLLTTGLEGHPEIEATLSAALGDALRSQGEYHKAEPLLRRAVQKREELQRSGATNDDALAEALFLLGWVLQDQGSYSEAEPTLLRALSLYQSQAPPNELKVAQVQFNLAWLLADTQRRAESEALFRQVLETRRKRLSPRDLELAAAQIGLIAVLLADNRERDALMLSLADTPPEHSAKLIGCLIDYQRISAHRQKGEWAEAERVCRGVLSTVNNVFVEHHPVRALVLGELAGIQQAGGDLVAAETSIREAIRIGRKCLGEHPKMWEPLLRFAEELHARGDWREAQDWADSAWRIVSQRLPEQEIRTFDIRSDVAWLRGKLAWDAGQSDAALSHFRESVHWRRQTTPDDAPHAHAIAFADRMAWFSRYLEEANQFDEAERTLRQARDLAERRNAAQRAICWTLQLASLLTERGDTESARRLRDDAETRLRSASPVAENCDRDECREWLRCWVAAGQPQEAVNFARRSLFWERSLSPRERPDVAAHALTLANLEAECGNWEAANTLLAEGLTLTVRKYGEFQTQAERVRLAQSRVWANQDRLADAERLAIEVALRLDRKLAFDDNHLDRALAWLTVGQIQRRAGSSAAHESLERSLRMRQAKLNARHPAVLEAANALNQLRAQQPPRSPKLDINELPKNPNLGPN